MYLIYDYDDYNNNDDDLHTPVVRHSPDFTQWTAPVNIS